MQVYDYLWFDAVHARRWRDKLGIWFRRTGWRPADVAERYPKSRVDLATFEKFDPVIAAPVRRYVLAQFMVAIAGVLLIADLYAKFGSSAVILPCLVLWVQLYTMGLLNEGRAYATQLEAIRLLVVVPVATGLMMYTSVIQGDTEPVWAVAGGYVFVSLSILLFARNRARKTSILLVKTNH
jgi:hypothetical protein